MRERVLTVTRDDCRWDYFRSGGNGGTNQNKTSTGARVTHPPSGAVGESRVHRSQPQNRQAAWTKMAKSPKFRMWVAEQSRRESVDSVVERLMEPQNIKVEVKDDKGRWTEDLSGRST